MKLVMHIREEDASYVLILQNRCNKRANALFFIITVNHVIKSLHCGFKQVVPSFKELQNKICILNPLFIDMQPTNASRTRQDISSTGKKVDRKVFTKWVEI